MLDKNKPGVRQVKVHVGQELSLRSALGLELYARAQ